MITEILKERAPDQKPRFFLHDEMIAWLKDNLKVKVQPCFTANAPDYDLAGKLGCSHVIPTHLQLDVTVKVGDEVIITECTVAHAEPYLSALKTLANVVEQCMIHINELHAANNELQKRIELIDKPSSV
jgi:hypothetical protein